jgi:hypothetical protein
MGFCALKRTTLRGTVSVTGDVGTQLSANLTLAATRHQFLDGFARRLSLVQDGVHLLGDGHFHASAMSEAHGGCGGEDSFGDHAVHAGDDVGQFLSAAEFDSHAAIA